MILTNNTFIKNVAENGGALRWTHINFTSTYINVTSRRFLQEEVDSNVFIDNRATYGPNQGSYPSVLQVYQDISGDNSEDLWQIIGVSKKVMEIVPGQNLHL